MTATRDLTEVFPHSPAGTVGSQRRMNRSSMAVLINVIYRSRVQLISGFTQMTHWECRVYVYPGQFELFEIKV